MEVLAAKQEQATTIGAFEKNWVFSALILTTIISSLLLAGDLRHWILAKSVYNFVVGNRASTQLIVQVCANTLGLLHVTILCVLFNYSTRLRLASVAISLDTFRFWMSLLSKRTDWTLPVHFLIPLLAFIGLSIAPSALWAAAITPVGITAFRNQMILLPSYSETTLLNYRWQERDSGPILRNSKGFFTYNIGEEFLGSILSSAASATTSDGSVRRHAKLDFSRFTYSNRSYGAGASVGLIDDNIILDPLVTQYSFQETGYAPMVTCIYNASSTYFINYTASDECKWQFVAEGYLRNSHPWEGEWSRYLGYSPAAIVAIGVATAPDAVGRMIEIASGIYYKELNSTQCAIDFQPTLFDITVDLADRNISVVPVKAVRNPTDIEPSGMLSFLTTWQLTLISTDQTSMYTSLVGKSINASITNYITFATDKATDPVSEAAAVMGGLGNSIAAMIDDILTLYASAQLMIANDTQPTLASVRFQAQKLGQRSYIIAVTVFNGLLVLLTLSEALRTRGWKGLADFDYMDPRNLIVGSSRGGEGIAIAADDKRASHNIAEKQAKAVDRKVGRILIVQKGKMLVSANSVTALGVEKSSDSSMRIGSIEEGTETLIQDEVTDAQIQDRGSEGLNLEEGTRLLTEAGSRERPTPSDEREESTQATEMQILILNEDRIGLVSDGTTEELLP